MKLAALISHWESVLKSEGLAPLDGSYTRKTRKICYAQPQRIAFGVHSAAYAFEHFCQCEEFARTKKAKWPRIWNMYAQGLSMRKIAAAESINVRYVHERIHEMIADMRAHFASQPQDLVNPPQGAEILEVIVEQQQRK